MNNYNHWTISEYDIKIIDFMKEIIMFDTIIDKNKEIDLTFIFQVFLTLTYNN